MVPGPWNARRFGPWNAQRSGPWNASAIRPVERQRDPARGTPSVPTVGDCRRLERSPTQLKARTAEWNGERSG
jgi:hypothetical protein